MATEPKLDITSQVLAVIRRHVGDDVMIKILSELLTLKVNSAFRQTLHGLYKRAMNEARK